MEKQPTRISITFAKTHDIKLERLRVCATGLFALFFGVTSPEEPMECHIPWAMSMKPIGICGEREEFTSTLLRNIIDDT